MNRLKSYGAGLAVAAYVAVACPALADVVYVDDSAPPQGDGLSWPTAFSDLQQALDLASAPGSSVTEIRIGQGVYKPSARTDQLDPRSATFTMRSGLLIAGGYAGFGAADPNARDVQQFATILSGDLASNDGPPGSWTNYDENAYHVVTASGVDETAVLDGVTITAGSACCGFEQFDPRSWGGGLQSISGSPTLRNCTLQFNQGGRGGAVYLESGNPSLEDCRIVSNRANTTNQRGGGIYSEGSNPIIAGGELSQNIAARGGAIYHRNAAIAINGCAFSQNQATFDHGGAVLALGATLNASACNFSENIALVSGAGLKAISGSTPAHFNLNKCTFASNMVGNGSSAAVDISGVDSSLSAVDCAFTNNSSQSSTGTIQTIGTHVIIQRCNFYGNSSWSGGALSVNDAPSGSRVEDCVLENNFSTFGGAGAGGFSGATVVDRCVFYNNLGSEHMGGIATGGLASIRNSLFWKNRSQANVGAAASAIWNSGPNVTITNCTMVENTSQSQGGGAIYSYNSIKCDNDILWGNTPNQIMWINSATVSHSDVQGGWNGPGTGNISTDPFFTNPLAGDYSLHAGSPCIDAASNLTVPRGTEFDLAGNPRFQDDPFTDDTGMGYPPVIDMGCYEFQALISQCAWDCAQPPDGMVNVGDLLMIINSWGLRGGPADINRDSLVNVTDLLAVIDHWGTCP